MKCRRKSLIDWLYKNVLQCFDWLIVEPFSWEFTKTNREGERTIGCLRKLKMYRLIDCWTLSWRFVLIWGSIFSRLHPASREEGRGDYHHHHTHGASSSPETTDSGNIIERRHSRWIRIQIGSVCRNFVYPDPYSKYRYGYGFTLMKRGKKSKVKDKNSQFWDPTD